MRLALQGVPLTYLKFKVLLFIRWEFFLYIFYQVYFNFIGLRLLLTQILLAVHYFYHRLDACHILDELEFLNFTLNSIIRNLEFKMQLLLKTAHWIIYSWTRMVNWMHTNFVNWQVLDYIIETS